jgi:[acyl-carrier-protein] S-malonyltransferase
MKPAAQRLAPAVQAVVFHTPSTPVLQNVTAAEAAGPGEIRRLLVEQLFSPVRWVETVEALGQRGVELIIEAGPGKVLTGLVKRIDKSLQALPVVDPASLDNAVEAVNA